MVTLDYPDLVDILTAQRNAAMDEIARQGAIIKKLQQENKRLSAPPTVPAGSTLTGINDPGTGQTSDPATALAGTEQPSS